MMNGHRMLYNPTVSQKIFKNKDEIKKNLNLYYICINGDDKIQRASCGLIVCTYNFTIN